MSFAILYLVAAISVIYLLSGQYKKRDGRSFLTKACSNPNQKGQQQKSSEEAMASPFPHTCSPLNDPNPSNSNSTAPATATTSQEEEEGKKKTSEDLVANGVRTTKRKAPKRPDNPREGRGGAGGSHH